MCYSPSSHEHKVGYKADDFPEEDGYLPTLTDTAMSQNTDLHDEIDQLAQEIEIQIRSNEALLDEAEFDPEEHGLKRIKEAIFG